MFLNHAFQMVHLQHALRNYYFASKELLVAMIYISTSRIPIIFGGMIVIEILSGGVYQGIGFSIWNNLYK